MIEKLLLVALGGAIGASLRFLSVNMVGRATGDLAFGTLFVNVIGSFAMGILAVILLERAPDSTARMAPLLMTGVLGGFTTFSAFSLDALRLYEDGHLVQAIGYVSGSVIMSIAGLAIGLVLGRWLLA